MSQAAANRALVLEKLAVCVGNVVSLAARTGVYESKIYRAILDLKTRGLIEPVDDKFEGVAYEELWRVPTCDS